MQFHTDKSNGRTHVRISHRRKLDAGWINDGQPPTAEHLDHIIRADEGGGVFVKAPKRRQDLRVDMPTIGPDTIDAVARAGLSTIVLAAGAVIVLARAQTCARAQAAGITISAQDI